MRRFVLATRNAHKVVEVRRILAAAGIELDLVGLDEVAPGTAEVSETGSTFAANAALKARAACEATGLPALADDSGLAVDALNGMPGIFSARWSGGGGDAANTDLVLRQLADVPADRRAARFVCAAVAVLPSGRELVAIGEIQGRLTIAPRGTNGFGYDPIFMPTGSDLTTAEMSAERKDAISHRGRAFREIGRLLSTDFAPSDA